MITKRKQSSLCILAVGALLTGGLANAQMYPDDDQQTPGQQTPAGGAQANPVPVPGQVPDQFPNTMPMATPLHGTFEPGSVEAWVDGVAEELKEAKIIAIQHTADGSYVRAIEAYKDGITRAQQQGRNEHRRYTWTFKMLDQTQNLVRNIEGIEILPQEKKDRAILTVMESSYQLVIDYYYDFDIQFFTPFALCNRGVYPYPTYNVNQFEEIAFQLARKQIDWFEQNFVIQSRDPMGGVYPNYDSKVFLAVLASMANGIAIDFSTDPRNPNPPLFPYRYAQMTQSLNKLVTRIDRYLDQGEIFTSSDRAVNFCWDDFSKITAGLKSIYLRRGHR